MYTSLTAKSWRLFKVARSAEQVRRVKVSVREIYLIVAVVLLIDLAILIAWVLVSPLQYIRSNVSTTLDEATGVLTIETTGICKSSTDNVSMWAFLGPIIAVHVGSMIITNLILFRVRGINNRYQEQKYVALASIYICELLLLGLPILIAVQESGDARYIVIAGVIFLTDTGVLALIFIPKIKYAKIGLPEGMSAAESVGIKRAAARRSNYKSNVASTGPISSSVEAIRKRATMDSMPPSAVEEIRRRALLASNGNGNVSIISTHSPPAKSSPSISVESGEAEEKVEEAEESQEYSEFLKILGDD